MATAAERLADALIAHQIDLQQFKKGADRKFQRLLRTANIALVEALRRRLNAFGETGPEAARKARSLRRIVDATLKQRREQWRAIGLEATRDARDFAGVENRINAEILDDAIAIEEFKAELLGAAALTAATLKPFRGRTLPQHVADTGRRDIANIRNAIQIGIAEGLTASQIISSMTQPGGAFQTSANNLNAVVNSSINSTSNAVAEGLWRENGIVSGLVWTAILDGRTTPICQSRDGKGVPLTDDFPAGIPLLRPQGARPPAHFNCRSHMIAVLTPSLVVPPHRTAVTTTLTVPARRRNFRTEARRRAGERWAVMTERQRRRAIRREANAFAEEFIGRVPPETTYGEWLGRQSAAFQDRVLGRSRGKLFRAGGLSVDQFVDFTGRTLTLDQLQQRHPRAFQRADIEVA